jgi:hypothetical protein
LRSLDGRIYSPEERWQLLEQVGNLSLNPNTLVKRIIKSNKIKLESEEKVPEEQLELEVKLEKLENSTKSEPEKVNIII